MISIIVIALMLSAFFSGIELAFLSANRLKIELDKEQGVGSGYILSEFDENSASFLTSLLIGNNIALIVFTSLMGSVLSPAEISWMPESTFGTLLVQTLITTIIVLIFGEILPKVLFRLAPNKILNTSSFLLKYCIYLPLKPFTWIFVSTSKGFIKLLTGKAYEEPDRVAGDAELEDLVKIASAAVSIDGNDDELNAQLFENALDLKDRKVRDCMVPRNEVIGVDIQTTDLKDLIDVIKEAKHSRIIVYRDNIDNIEGYVHHYSLFDANSKKIDQEGVLFDLPSVPESMNARDLLSMFTKERKSIAKVADEYGGTAGIITLEDIIEEIFGEIDDEHDEQRFMHKKIGINEYRFSARNEIEFINETYNLELAKGDYTTLSGYILAHHEDIPATGDVIIIEGAQFTIEEAQDHKIETVVVKTHPEIDN